MRLKYMFVLFLTALAACDGGTTNRERADFLVQRGKHEMSQSQFQFASQTFSQALEYDASNKEARFGHALSETLVSYEQFSLVIRAAGFGDLVPQAATPRPGDGATDEADMYNRIILGILYPIRDQLAVAAAEFDSLRGSEFQFQIDELPVQWNASTILNLHGTWREGDVRFVGGMVHGLVGTLDFLFAHELKFDLFDTLDYFTAYTGTFESFDFTPPQLLNVAVHVLIANPNFLELLQRDADGDGSVDGVTLPPIVAEHFRKAALDWAVMREKAAAHPGLFRVEEGKSDVIGVLTAKNVLVVAKPSDSGALQYGVIEIPVTERFETGLHAIAANLAGGGARVEWKAHVLPILGVVAVSAAKIVNQFDLDLSAGVKTALSLLKAPKTVEDLVLNFVPDVIAFDLGAYFAHPVGIRAFLPRWREEGVSEDQNSFVFEWECNYAHTPTAPVGSGNAMLYYKKEGDTSAQYHFTCPATGIVDVPHFPVDATAPGAAIYETLKVDRIEADGIANGLPYIVFGDPSLDQVLYIKADKKGAAGKNPVGAGGFETADQRTLNALLAQIYDRLPSF